MQDFKGKTALVTGAGSGIGLGMAHAFAGAGMNVVLADLRQAASVASSTAAISSVNQPSAASAPTPRRRAPSASLSSYPPEVTASYALRTVKVVCSSPLVTATKRRTADARAAC